MKATPAELAYFSAAKYFATDVAKATVKRIRAKLNDGTGLIPSVSATLRVSSNGGIINNDLVVADSTSLQWSSVVALAMHRSGMHKGFILGIVKDIISGNLTPTEERLVKKFRSEWEHEVKPLLPTRTNDGKVELEDLEVRVVE